MAKRRSTPGTKLVSAEITEALGDAFKEYARGRGETLREALERAMRREMANPPPKPVDPPFPPLVPPVVKKGKK